MLCEKCNKNPATIHQVSVINGEKTESHLCAECAGKKEASAFQKPFSINDIISGFFNTNQPGQIEEKVCPKCGNTTSRFKKYGKLGCANCYDEFREELFPMLKSFHGSTHHNGRTIDVRKNQSMSKADALKIALKDAIAAENYEQAAQIRDQIKKLSEGNEGKGA